jgi:hypothetical protein
MLAGRVKLKRFLLYAVCLDAVCVAGLVIWCSQPEEYVAPVPHFVEDPIPELDLAVQPVPTPAEGQPPHLAAVLAFLGKDLGTDKVKDAVSGESWKVNLYQDEGHATVNRAKVDLDRDESWDEKWTFAADGASRQVAPADDEAYSETWLHSPLGWYLEGTEPPAAATPEQVSDDPVPAHATASDPWVAGVMYYRGKDLGTTKLKDVSKGQVFKINVYQDAGNAAANRAKVDIDRDDQWDQKWTFDDSGASVKIAPHDDEDYSESKRWTEQGWAED